MHTHTHTRPQISKLIAAKHSPVCPLFLSVLRVCLPVFPHTQTSPQRPLKLDNASGGICKHTHTHLHFYTCLYIRSEHTNTTQLPCYRLTLHLSYLVSPPSPCLQRLYILGLRQFTLTCLQAEDRLMGRGCSVVWCGERWDVGGVGVWWRKIRI